MDEKNFFYKKIPSISELSQFFTENEFLQRILIFMKVI